MKLEVNVNKKRFFVILGAMLLLAGVFVVYAYGSNPANPAVFGHSANEIEGVCRSDGTGCPAGGGGGGKTWTSSWTRVPDGSLPLRLTHNLGTTDFTATLYVNSVASDTATSVGPLQVPPAEIGPGDHMFGASVKIVDSNSVDIYFGRVYNTRVSSIWSGGNIWGGAASDDNVPEYVKLVLVSKGSVGGGGTGLCSNTPIISSMENDKVYQNTGNKPLIVVAWMNSQGGNNLHRTSLNGYVSSDTTFSIFDDTPNSELAASEAGPARKSITFVVPVEYYYKVSVEGTTTGDSVILTARAWEMCGGGSSREPLSISTNPANGGYVACGSGCTWRFEGAGNKLRMGYGSGSGFTTDPITELIFPADVTLSGSAMIPQPFLALNILSSGNQLKFYNEGVLKGSITFAGAKPSGYSTAHCGECATNFWVEDNKFYISYGTTTRRQIQGVFEFFRA